MKKLPEQAGRKISRKKFLMEAMAIPAALMTLSKESKAQQSTEKRQLDSIENAVTKELEPHGISLDQPDLERLSDPMNRIPSPLGVFSKVIQEHPGLRERITEEKTLIRKLLSIEISLARIHAKKVRELLVDLPTLGTISRTYWTSYGVINLHVASLVRSSILFENYLQGGNSETVIGVIRKNIETALSHPGYVYVGGNASSWKNETRRNRAGQKFTAELATERKRYKEMMETTIENFFPSLISEKDKLLNIARCESGFNPKAYNPPYATSGIFQIRPETWEMLQNTARFTRVFQRIGVDPQRHSFSEYRFNPEINMKFGLTLYEVDGDQHWLASKSCWG